MTTVADRYRNVAAGFTRRVDAVPSGGWQRPAPCEGWVALDVVRHLIEWIPPFLHAGAGIDIPTSADVDDDPASAWRTTNEAIQRVLDDPSTPTRVFEHPRAGRHRLDEAIGMFILGDVLVHTWDLARATGQEETLDPHEVRAMLAGLEPVADMLSQSGQYAERVVVPDDADGQTKLIALTGRNVGWAAR